MRPYQIAATESILNRIHLAYQNKLYGKVEGGGYIWHTTGSGKTLTSLRQLDWLQNWSILIRFSLWWTARIWTIKP